VVVGVEDVGMDVPVLEEACERLRGEIENGTGSMREERDELDRVEQWLTEVECERARSGCV